MKASNGPPATDGEMWKKCATIGMPHTPDSVVTTAKWEAKLIAHPQFAISESARRAAVSTLFKLLLPCAAGAGLSATAANERFATPTQAMTMKQVRQPKPVTAAASGAVATIPPT